MAIDDMTSPGQPKAPSLLAGRTHPDERDPHSSRILANLEGRTADAERQHLPAEKKRSSRGLLALLLLLLLVAAGAGLAYWRNGNVPSVVTASQDGVKPSAGQPASGGDSSANANTAGTTAKPAAAAVPAPGALASVPAPASADSRGKTAEAQPAAPAQPSSAASIVDTPSASLHGEDDGQPRVNPLSVLASTAPAQGASANGKAAANPHDANTGANKGKPAAKNTHASGKTKKAPDGDAALLSALISYGLPVPNKVDGSAVLPGTPLAERLQQCRRKPFLESEQCRLQVCAGQWGLAPECPNPQAQSQH